MRNLGLGIVAIVAAIGLSTGAALAQASADNNESSTVIQNNDATPNSGQQGSGTQLNDATNVEIGTGSNFVAAQDDVAVDGVNAQAYQSTAVGGNYDTSENTTFTGTFVQGDLAGGDVVEVSGDAVFGAEGAVEDGAGVYGGGVAFGAGTYIGDDVAIVGGDGLAAVSGDEIVDDGSSLVIGGSNTTVSAHNDAVAVGNNGNAIYINDADDNQVVGFGNVVAMSELDQEYSAPVVAGPSADQFFEDQGDYEETFALRDEVIDTTQDPDLVVGTTIVGTNQAYGTVATGGVSNISAADVSGINDMFFATGVGNQGHIGSVGASVSELTMN